MGGEKFKIQKHFQIKRKSSEMRELINLRYFN